MIEITMNSTKATFISLFTLLLGCAISVQVKAQQKTVTMQPEKPAPGDTVTITYHPDSPDAAIKSPDSLKLVFSFSFAVNLPRKYDMKRTSGGWVTSIPLSKHFTFDSFYFKSGKKTDKNTIGHLYELFAYKNGNPVKGAYLRKVVTLKYEYPKASRQSNKGRAIRLLNKELKFHPDNYSAQMILYAFQVRQPGTDHITILKKAHKRIDQKLAENPKSWVVINAVTEGYEAIGEKGKGKKVEKRIIKKYPNSDIAMYQLYHKAMEQKDRDKGAQLLKKYVNADYKQSYINKYYTWGACANLFIYYAKKDSVEALHHIAKLWLQPNPRIIKNPRLANDYNAAAIFLTKNTHLYDWAEQLAKKALQLAKNEPAAEGYKMTKYGYKLKYLSKNEAKKQRKYRKANILAILGLIYTKQGKYDKAQATLMEAVNTSDESVNAKEYLADLYMKKAGNSGHKKLAKQAARDSMNKAAPSLANAVDLKGAPLDTTALAGKVVVLDFRTTGSEKTKNDLLLMQKVYDKFKDNPGVKFVMLDDGLDNTLEEVRKWKKKQDYTFPIYYDENARITTAFGITKMPAIVVIGKNGGIQFKEVELHGPSVEKKLVNKIDMALKGENKAAKR